MRTYIPRSYMRPPSEKPPPRPKLFSVHHPSAGSPWFVMVAAENSIGAYETVWEANAACDELNARAEAWRKEIEEYERSIAQPGN